MRKSTAQNEPTDYPEFAVRAEVIRRFFSPPLASSTFHDLVNKGRIVPFKGIRGFYKLNDSLRRLGLRELAKLPDEIPVRTPEEIIYLAFLAIDPEVFNAPSWLLGAEIIAEADVAFHLKEVEGVERVADRLAIDDYIDWDFCYSAADAFRDRDEQTPAVDAGDLVALLADHEASPVVLFLETMGIVAEEAVEF